MLLRSGLVAVERVGPVLQKGRQGRDTLTFGVELTLPYIDVSVAQGSDIRFVVEHLRP